AGAGAVARLSAAGVADDLAPGEARVAHRPADGESSGAVDDVARAIVDEVTDGRPDDALDDVVAEARVWDPGVVLRGHDDLVHARRAAALVLDGDLRLAVGPQVAELAAL